MNRDMKRWWTMLVALLATGVALAGCTDADEEATQEDVGEGIVEPEPDVGPAEEEFQPAEQEPVGTDFPAENQELGEEEAGLV